MDYGELEKIIGIKELELNKNKNKLIQ